MKRALFIYNPRAGTHSLACQLDEVVAKFQDAGIIVDFYRSQSAKNEGLIEILRDNEYSTIVISGGDGTINTLLNILIKNNIQVPLGLLPSGTCNDFGRSIGLPTTFSEGLDVIIKGCAINVDVGLINNEKYFFSTCAGGLFVNIPLATHNELKKRLGPFAYYIQALSEVMHLSSFPLTVKTDNETITENILLFLILNGKHGAGFSNVIKEAKVTDGFMHILLVKECTHVDLAALTLKILNNEKLVDKNIIKIKTSSCLIESGHNIAVSIDGENGPTLPYDIEFFSDRLKIFVP